MLVGRFYVTHQCTHYAHVCVDLFTVELYLIHFSISDMNGMLKTHPGGNSSRGVLIMCHVMILSVS